MARKVSQRHLAWAAAKAGGVTVPEIAKGAGVSEWSVRKALLRVAGIDAATTTTTTTTTTGATGSVKRPLHVDSYGTGPEPMPGAGIKADPSQPLTFAQRTALAVQAIEDAGVSRTAAFSIAGIPKATGFYKLANDPAFREAIELAEARMEAGPARNLKRLAEGSQQGAMVAAAIFLGRRLPGSWAEKRHIDVDVSGHVTQELNIRHVLRSAESIAAMSALETSLQQDDARSLPAHEDDVIEGELADVKRPELP